MERFEWILPAGIYLLTSLDGNCVQTIAHPAISVWSVAVHPETGDVVTGASDRMVRVFSRDPQKWATEEQIKVSDMA
jgi:phospholipase A-2-activating protein